MADVSGRVVIVTGAGGGLGAYLAEAFAATGAAVVLHCRESRVAADATASRIGERGGRASVWAGDLREKGAAERLAGHAIERFGAIDVLVNNAGSYPVIRAMDMTASEWDDVLSSNLTTAFLCSQAVARAMASKRGGAIVNITSIEAFHPADGHAHYNAAKAGLEMLTRSLALELGPSGIRVNAVAPGLIWRDGIEAAWPDGVERWLRAAPLRTLVHPRDVANACVFLAGPNAAAITGTTLVVDAGVTARAIF